MPEVDADTTLLLVEDEAIIALATSTLLKNCGYTVRVAYGGKDAIEAALEDDSINLILMDIDLGRGMDGPEAARQILSRRELPIVFLTSHAEEEYVKRVEQITRYGYVLKDSGRFVLLQAIKMAMELYRSKRITEQHLHNSLVANAELEQSQLERARISRLYTTLRKINQVIADTSDLDTILTQVCETFVSVSRYPAAWISLFTPDDTPRRFFSAYNREILIPHDESGPEGPIPECAREALKTLKLQYIDRNDPACGVCPWLPEAQAEHHNRYPSITIPLFFTLEKLGWLTIMLPANVAQVSDEMELLREISQEVSMAIISKGSPRLRDIEKQDIGLFAEESRGETSFSREGSSPTTHYLQEELTALLRTDSSVFGFLQAGSLDGLWYWDLIRREHEWMSPEFWRLFGYDPEEKTHSPAEWQEMIFQEDLKLALENLNRHLENPEYPYDQVVRYRHKDGSTVWVRCRGIAIRDPQGNPVRMLGAHNDMTAQMRARQKLLEQLELRETLFKKLTYQTKNNLLLTSSLIAVQESAQGIDLGDLQNRVKSIQMLYQKLYESENMLQISINEYLQAIVRAAFSGYLVSALSIEVELPRLLIESQKAALIGLLINEFVYTAIRGGFSHAKAPRFSLTGETDSKETLLHLQVEYTRGEESESPRREDSFGLNLITLLLQELGGSFEEDSVEGRYRLSIPLESWLSVKA